ncbi:MAG TPA: PadR family transcriptional regulator [Anaerolineae bacterium]|nr:PadR family transcriptional regulator [Anaerolineae bacterium]
MSLKHALLGFLSYAPMTGYELKQHFDQSIYYFWNAKLSQIYPTLNRMKEEGLLTMEVKYQEDKPNRKVYHITDAGREELQRWLREPADLSPVRVAFLIKVFFGGRLEKEEILAQLRRHLALRREQLAAYRGPVREVLQQNIEATGLEREGFFWGLTLDMGIKYVEGWIEWCERAIEKIEAMNDDM